MCGSRIPIGCDACDKDGVETCRPAESATRRMAKAARPGNGAVCLALDAQRSGLARLVTTEPPLMARAIERFGDSAAAPL